MKTLALLAAALSLRDGAFVGLRARSDVFYRGFLVLLVSGLIAGAFQAGVDVLSRARPVGQEQLTEQIMQGIDQSGLVFPGFRDMIQGSVSESVGIGADISALPPQAGEAFRPAAYFLDWLGGTLGTPFGAGFSGWLLVVGLLVHLTSRWLGGRAGAAQMLGLAALAFAPYVLSPLAAVLKYIGGDQGAAGSLAGVVSWVIFLWALIVLVKATSVAQGLGIARSVGALVLAALVGVLLAFASLFLLSAIVSGVVVSLLPASIR
ncbi:MAG: YIP1 family protein [Rudaea sp.]